MKTLLIIIALASFTFAQEDDPLKFFPYKTGDMWEYYLDDLQYPDTSQTFNISDSVDAEANIFVTQVSRRINPIQPPFLFPDTATYIIDTSFNVLAPPGWPIEKYYIKYKLNAEQGDQWIIFDYSEIGGIGYEIVRLQAVWDDELFFGSGIYTTFKYYTYFYAPNSTDTLGLDRYGDILTKGFGLWWRGGGDTFGDWFLKGCVINDSLYGDTTNIITSVKDLSENLISDFVLYPNFPNPFNSFTTINFKISKDQKISIIIYDLLGKEVTRLIDNEFYYSGIHKINWNSKNNSDQTVSSGVYYYRFISDGINLTRSMILMK